MPIDLKGMLAKRKALAERSQKSDSDLFSPNLEASHILIDDLLDSEISIGIDSSKDPDTYLIELKEGEVDPRLKLLSHSSRTTLHSCPRKYQLYRLNSTEVPLEADAAEKQSVTFAYGSAVGIGIQSALEGKTDDQVLMDVFMEWDTDLLYSNARQNKSFWLAVQAVRKFIALQENDYLEDYELVYLDDKDEAGKRIPAVELSFLVYLPDGYKYRGFVDAVLKHKHTDEIKVLELKTTSGKANSAMYKNSGQALGYSVVLDILFPSLSSYSVLYLVYESRSMEYVELEYQKSLLQRALWLQELLIDTKKISMYEEFETYPMHGESCFNFFRECEYLGTCTLNIANLIKPLDSAMLASMESREEDYKYKISFEDLIAAQIKKGEL